MTKINKYLRMPASTKMLLIEAFFWSLIANIVIGRLPLKYYTRLLLINQQKTQTSKRSQEMDELVCQIKSTICILVKNAPWKVKCYSQAIVAKQLFHKKGLNTTLKLGLAKDDNKQLIAHAWLLLGDRCMTGGRNHHLFTPIAEFN